MIRSVVASSLMLSSTLAFARYEPEGTFQCRVSMTTHSKTLAERQFGECRNGPVRKCTVGDGSQSQELETFLSQVRRPSNDFSSTSSHGVLQGLSIPAPNRRSLEYRVYMHYSLSDSGSEKQRNVNLSLEPMNPTHPTQSSYKIDSHGGRDYGTILQPRESVETEFRFDKGPRVSGPEGDERLANLSLRCTYVGAGL
jgi:hypothetical protein